MCFIFDILSGQGKVPITQDIGFELCYVRIRLHIRYNCNQTISKLQIAQIKYIFGSQTKTFKVLM